LEWLGHFVEDLETKMGHNLLSVIIFGSTGRGEDLPDSDLDVLIICKGVYETLEKECRKIAITYTLQIRRKVSVQVYVPEDISYMIDQKFPFILGVASGYHILYDREDFFTNQMKRIKEMERLGEIRRFSKSYVWITK
jgi:predicted nucleotidyltransferase